MMPFFLRVQPHKKATKNKAKSFEKYLPILKIGNIPLILDFCLFPLPKLMKERCCVQDNK